MIVIDEDEQKFVSNEDVEEPIKSFKRFLGISTVAVEAKKQKSIPNIANELARNRAESRQAASGSNSSTSPAGITSNAQDRPRLHAIPLSSLLSPSIDYSTKVPSPHAIPPPFSSVSLKSESPDINTAEGSGQDNNQCASQGVAVNEKTKSSFKSSKSTTSTKKRVENSRNKGGGKKMNVKKSTAKNIKADPVTNTNDIKASMLSDPKKTTSPSASNARKVILPSQDVVANTNTNTNNTNQPVLEEKEVHNILVATTSSPVHTPPIVVKGLKKTHSTLNPSSLKQTMSEETKAKKTLSTPNVLSNAITSPLLKPIAVPSALTNSTTTPPITTKKTNNESTLKKDVKSKAKQSSSKKKDASNTAPVVATEKNSPSATAPQTPKKLVQPHPIKSPSILEVFDHKTSSNVGKKDEEIEENPIIVLDIPLYQVDNGEYLDENGQVVFNFYNLVQEKFGLQGPISKGNNNVSNAENGDDLDNNNFYHDDEDGYDDEEETGLIVNSLNPTKSKKKPNPLKGKSKVGKYDIEDPFIDDSELVLEEERAATKDGFFVYFGPLIQKGQYATFERVDGTMKKGGVRNPR